MSTQALAEKNLIYKVRAGSHAYGTNVSTSDVDQAGIYIPPVEYFFGLQAFDRMSEHHNEGDNSYHSLRDYANLAVANNPNVLELLFVDERDILLETPAARQLRQHRNLFLSQRCQKTFVGYAEAQLHRIRTHTKWLAQELHDMEILWPYVMNQHVCASWVRWRFGDNMLKRVAQEFDKMERVSARLSHSPDLIRMAKKNFYSSESTAYEPQLLEAFKNSFVICPDKSDPRFQKEETEFQGRSTEGISRQTFSFQKHLYDEAKKKRDQYVTWMAERNPMRHETELKFGYDTKHAMHLIRLLRMGYEILTEGELRVRRPDAAELLDIRAGKWTYEQVTEYADEMVAKIDAVGGGSGVKAAVPDTPDINKINTLVIHITQDYLAGYHGDNT